MIVYINDDWYGTCVGTICIGWYCKGRGVLRNEAYHHTILPYSATLYKKRFDALWEQMMTSCSFFFIPFRAKISRDMIVPSLPSEAEHLLDEDNWKKRYY